MPTGLYNKEKAAYGKKNEDIIQHFLPLIYGEAFRHTTAEKDELDFVSENYWVELKTRKPTYSWCDDVIKREGFLMPHCKLIRALNERRATKFLYYWKKDHSLWEWSFTEDAAKSLKPFVPHFHYTKQVHVNIPFDWWKRIGTIDEETMTLARS